MGGGIRVFWAPRSHYLVRGGPEEGDPPPELDDASARRFWRHYNLVDSDGCAYALQEGRLVGFFRFSSCKTYTGTHSLLANGTWVHPSCRNLGVGTRMWEKVLERKRPYLDVVSVCTETKSGAKLIASLRKRYPQLRWVVVVDD
jgi:GNAT superfamily N-acetyltransferase